MFLIRFKLISMIGKLRSVGANNGQSVIEILLAIGLSTIFLPALITGVIASKEGKAQQKQRLEAVTILKQSEEAVRNVRESGWDLIP
jgi:hypothetical protein